MKDLYGWNVHPEDDIRTERDLVKATEEEFEKDRQLLQDLMNEHPVVSNTIIKLRCENSELKHRIHKLEREIHRIQHERPPFYDLGQ